MILPEDAEAVFGHELSTADYNCQWRESARAYACKKEGDEREGFMRLARMESDLYLAQLAFNDDAEPHLYGLTLVQIGSASDVTVLSCESLEGVAWAYGVEVASEPDVVRVEGDREQTLGLLLTSFRMGLCPPLEVAGQVQKRTLASELVPPPTDLAMVAAARVPSEQRLPTPIPCTPCPTDGGGCVQGSVLDSTGAPLSQLSIQLVSTGTTGGSAIPQREIVTGDDGEFFVQNLPAGSHEIRVEPTGYTALRLGFTVHPAETAYFHPAKIFEAVVPETITVYGATRCPS